MLYVWLPRVALWIFSSLLAALFVPSAQGGKDKNEYRLAWRDTATHAKTHDSQLLSEDTAIDAIRGKNASISSRAHFWLEKRGRLFFILPIPIYSPVLATDVYPSTEGFHTGDRVRYLQDHSWKLQSGVVQKVYPNKISIKGVRGTIDVSSVVEHK
jgi:hypothetical protein